jgi:hypothetical protein
MEFNCETEPFCCSITAISGLRGRRLRLIIGQKRFQTVNLTNWKLMRQRPMSTLIFGILNIGFGLWQLVAAPLFALFQSRIQGAMAKSNTPNPMLALQSDPSYAALTKYRLEVGAVLGVALLVLGIGLLLLKNWARLGSIIFALIDIVVVLVIIMISWPITMRLMQQMPNVPPGMAQGFAMIGLALQLVFGLAYPALLLFFMTRTNVIEACQQEQEPPPAQEPV